MMIWFDLIWFDLIWFDLIWFESITEKDEGVKRFNILLSFVFELYCIEYYHKEGVQQAVYNSAANTELPRLFAEVNL